MRLSENEKLVLAATELLADAPAATLQKATGLRQHTIRYSLSRLRQRNVIRQIPLINPFVFGMQLYNIFFSIGAERRSQRDSFIKMLLSEPEVTWIGEFGGEFQYGIAVMARSMGDVVNLMNRLAKRFERIFFDKSISLQYATTVYHRKYLTSKILRIRPRRIESSTGAPAVMLDALDRKMLQALSESDDMSLRKVAQKVGVAHSTFQLRLKKLSEIGAIVGSMLVVDSAAFDAQGFKLLLYARGLSYELDQALQKFCAQHKNVIYLIECLGSWDFEIGVEVMHAEEVSEIIQQLYDSFGEQLRAIKVLSKFRDLKVKWFPS